MTIDEIKFVNKAVILNKEDFTKQKNIAKNKLKERIKWNVWNSQEIKVYVERVNSKNGKKPSVTISWNQPKERESIETT